MKAAEMALPVVVADWGWGINGVHETLAQLRDLSQSKVSRPL
jgi:hypothetical protein